MSYTVTAVGFICSHEHALTNAVCSSRFYHSKDYICSARTDADGRYLEPANLQKEIEMWQCHKELFSGKMQSSVSFEVEI